MIEFFKSIFLFPNDSHAWFVLEINEKVGYWIIKLGLYKLEFVILALPTISAAFVRVLNRICDRVAFWYTNWVNLKEMLNNSVFQAETAGICTILCNPTPLWLTAVRPWWVPSSNQIVRSLGSPPQIYQNFQKLKCWPFLELQRYKFGCR